MFPFIIFALGARLAEGAGSRSGGVRGAQAGTDVYYATRMLDLFQNFANRRDTAKERFHLSEQDRLENAMVKAVNPQDKSLLEIAARRNEESRLEAEGALTQLKRFVSTMKQALGARGSAASCQELTCGERSYCAPGDNSTPGPLCRCHAGYEGDGFVCNMPAVFKSEPLISLVQNAPAPQVADVNVFTMQGHRMAVTFRDVARGHQAYLLLGQATEQGMRWGQPVLLSNTSRAFNPVFAELEDGRSFAVAYRDANRDGTAVLVSGSIDPVTGEVALTAPRAFAKHQAQAMAILPLPGFRVAVMYSEHVPMGGKNKMAMYGSTILAQIHPDGNAPEMLGKRRFVSGPVARLSATLLSPSSFVVAYRRGDLGTGEERAEASVMLAQVKGHEVAFDPNPLSIEPEQTQIWARSLALIQENTFAYTYHSGNEKITKQAILRVDPATKRLAVLQKPHVVGRGFTPFAGSVGAAFVERGSQRPAIPQEKAPRLLTFLDDGTGAKPQVQACKVTGSGLPAKCRSLEWSGHAALSMTGAPVGDGRVLLVSTDHHGAPHFQLVGMLEAM